ncbi:MAG: hypothetical protein IKG15_07080 [Solobacterium sp.]|nr:hypothetical protein [Solobacterium sp.]
MRKEPFIPERYKEMLKLRSKKRNDVALKIARNRRKKLQLTDDGLTKQMNNIARRIREAAKDRLIDGDLLEEISSVLDCDPRYLTGELKEKALYGYVITSEEDRFEIEKDHLEHTDSKGRHVGHYEDILHDRMLDAFEKWFELARKFTYFEEDGKPYTLEQYEKEQRDYERDIGLPKWAAHGPVLTDYEDMAMGGIIDCMKHFHDIYRLKKENSKEYYRRVNYIKGNSKKGPNDHDEEEQ